MASAFKSIPFSVVSIGSNHTGDWGPEGAEDTYLTFKELGIPTIGAGRNIAEARREVVLTQSPDVVVASTFFDPRRREC